MSSWGALRDLPREVWYLAGVALVNRAGTMALPFLILYLTERLGMAPERAGLLLAVYGAGSLVSAPVSGRIADRVGPRRVMQLSLAGSGAILLLYPLAESFAALAAVTLLWALVADALPPASLAMTSALVPSAQRKTAFALNRLAVNLGMSIGPAAGGLLATVSFAWLFVVDGATSLAAALALTLLPFPYVGPPRGDVGGGSAPASVIAPRALGDARLRMLLAGVFAVAVVYYQILSTLPLHFSRNLGLSEATIGLLFASSTLLIVALELPINIRTAGWPHRRTLVVGVLLVAVGFGATGLADSAWTAALTIAVWTLGEIALFPAFSAFVADLAPEERRGEYMGLYLFAFNAALAIGPWLGTQVFASAGATTLWAGCFVWCLGAAGLFWAASAPQKTRSQER